ncbi:UDP-N-acetylmuramate--L-alanine ligase [Candidatus Roizmanbacteria bacterium]|nr:UDP-N-acetylmuramate--L-alanine ligase [Candidatus Roizmanbacteria bacterium]
MLDQIKSVFFLGIKGVAMANLALILKKMGKNVTGSDTDESQITDKLPKNVDLVVYSAAHGGINNPQVVEAKKRGVSVVHQAEFQGVLMNQFKTKIAVCGSHGKTTTAAILSYCLLKLGAKLGYMVGTSTFNDYFGGDYLGDDYFVIEADEYGVNPPSDKTPKFLFLNPDIILSTNIDFDHPDVYANEQESAEAYIKFIKKAKTAYVCKDDPETKKALTAGSLSAKTYGQEETSDLVVREIVTNEEGSSFKVSYQRKELGEFKLAVYGEKNVLNAAGITLVLLDLGFDSEKIKEVISGFKGSKRRFELKFEKDGTYLLDDYAHHPKEIEATIQAARSRFAAKRIIIVFQSHTYSRTYTLLDGFAESLSRADLSYVMPIFPSARENPEDFKVSEKDVEKKAKEMGKSNVMAVSTKEEVIQKLKDTLKKGDVVFTMGAGDVYKLADDIINLIIKA